MVILTGILILIAIIVLSIFVWIKIKVNAFFTAIILVLLTGLMLRVFVGSDIRLHDWDEQYHALVAKNLVANPLKPVLYSNPVLPYDKDNWVGNHIWLLKPPTALWSMAISIYAFGLNSWAVRIPSLIFGLLSVLLTYKIGSWLFDKRVGIFAAYLHAVNGIIIELGAGRISSDHVETSFLFFVELAIFISIYFTRKNQHYTQAILTGLAIGLAFLSKWYPAGIVLPIWMLIVIHFGNFKFKDVFKYGALMIGIAVSIGAIWLWFITTNYHQESTFVMKKFLFAYSAPVENHFAPWYYYLHKVMVIYGELIYFAIAYSVYHLYLNKNRYQNFLLLVWIVLPILIFSFGETKRFTYLLISAPAFFILGGQLWFFIYDRIKQSDKKIISYIILGVLIILPLRLTIERIKPFEVKTATNDPFYLNIDSYQEQLGPNDVVFNCDQNIKLMFYTSVGAAYSKSPSKAEILQLKKNGFTIYLLENNFLVKY